MALGLTAGFNYDWLEVAAYLIPQSEAIVRNIFKRDRVNTLVNRDDGTEEEMSLNQLLESPHPAEALNTAAPRQTEEDGFGLIFLLVGEGEKGHPVVAAPAEEKGATRLSRLGLDAGFKRGMFPEEDLGLQPAGAEPLLGQARLLGRAGAQTMIHDKRKKPDFLIRRPSLQAEGQRHAVGAAGDAEGDPAGRLALQQKVPLSREIFRLYLHFSRMRS